MLEGRVVDTNVLIVASAADHGSPFPADGTPVEEAALRSRVLDWLEEFERDPERHAVLDWHWHICGEYQDNLTEQDYGWLALMHKKDRDEVTWIGLEVDKDRNAVLPAELAQSVTDLDDRKMVAAVMAATAGGLPCKLTTACDTDWLDCEQALKSAGIETEHLLEDWLRAKWSAMRHPGP